MPGLPLRSFRARTHLIIEILKVREPPWRSDEQGIAFLASIGQLWTNYQRPQFRVHIGVLIEHDEFDITTPQCVGLTGSFQLNQGAILEADGQLSFRNLRHRGIGATVPAHAEHVLEVFPGDIFGPWSGGRYVPIASVRIALGHYDQLHEDQTLLAETPASYRNAKTRRTGKNS